MVDVVQRDVVTELLLTAFFYFLFFSFQPDLSSSLSVYISVPAKCTQVGFVKPKKYKDNKNQLFTRLKTSCNLMTNLPRDS